MKFYLTIFSAIVAVSVLLFTVTPINACEESCRQGISHAFGDNYSIEIKNLFKTFVEKLEENAYFGLNSVKSSTKSACNKAIEEGTDKFQTTFSNSLAQLIEGSIFDQSPQFKGQCQHPLRVTQPPAGVAWTMDDCNNQDYICGNPPAICHFMDQYVKPRNVKNVIESMTERLSGNGTFYKSLTKSVIDASKKSGVKGDELKTFTTAVKDNILKTFNIFSSYFASEFCKGTTCDHYDHDIKMKLLSYP